MKIFAIALAALFLLFVAYYGFENGRVCGGIAGNLARFGCKPGFTCRPSAIYADSTGACEFAPASIISFFFPKP